MFGPRYFGGRAFGRRYWPSGAAAPAAPSPYWPPRYYGGRYFGQHYFPGGTATTPTVVPVNLVQAIGARWTALGLTASVGKLYQSRTQASEAPPNCIVTVKRGSPCLLTSTSSFYNYTVSFRVREAGAATAHVKALLVQAGFDQIGLSWTGGFAAKLTQEDWPSGVEPGYSAANAQVHWEEIHFLTRVKGAR